MNVEYIEVYEDYGMISYKPLNPTGKWKIESGPYYKNMLFIEHKGLIFKRWVPEGSIKFLPKKEAITFECGNE